MSNFDAARVSTTLFILLVTMPALSHAETADRLPYVEVGATNTRGDACFSTEKTNAAVHLLSGFLEVWKPRSPFVDAGVEAPAKDGCPAVAKTDWDGIPFSQTDGRVVNQAVHDANIAYVIKATRGRTAEEAMAAYLDDRRGKNASIVDGLGPLTAAWKAGSKQTTTINEVAADYIVVVGGLLSVSEPVDRDTVAFLRLAASQGVRLIGVCTGSFILAEAGLMGGHETCVSWLHYQQFRERFPDLRVRSDRLFHLNGSRGSCAGGSSSADLANHLVLRHIGRDAARNALEVLQIDRARSATDAQARRPLLLNVDDPRIHSVLIRMEQHLEGDLPLEELARSVGLSRRELERLFEEKMTMSPGAAYRQIRLEHARDLLQNTGREVVDVAFDVGYVSASHFAKAFKQAFGQTPSSMRISRAYSHEPSQC